MICRCDCLINPGLIGSHLSWGTIAVPGDEPGFVVVVGKVDERGAQFFDGIEGSDPEQGLRQGSYKAFCDAVALRLSHEGRRRLDTHAFDLVLEIAGHVVGACLLYTSPSPRDRTRYRMPSSA